MKRILLLAFLVASVPSLAGAQKSAWRQATDTELATLLPARAPVIKEHIETEMRTASGIVNGRGRYIAGVVLITAGYSAEGKYSHFLVVQAPIRLGGVDLKPGEFVFGYTHEGRSSESAFQRCRNGCAGWNDRRALDAFDQGSDRDSHLAAGDQGCRSNRSFRNPI